MPLTPETFVLVRDDALRVRQVREWSELLSPLEHRNRYEVRGSLDEPLLYAGEVGSGMGRALLRSFLKARRPFTLELRNPAGAVVLRLVRPFRLLLSRLRVEDREGHVLGEVRQRFRLLRRTYDVVDPQGQPLARLVGPLLRPWTFHLERKGRPLATIQKRWRGLGVELLTDADSFGVRFEPALQDPTLRLLTLAATFLVDFVHFEKKRGD
jgi:uncharacterized protein YxjI